MQCPPNIRDYDLNGDGKLSRGFLGFGSTEYSAYTKAVALCKQQERNRHSETQTGTRVGGQVAKVQATGEYSTEGLYELLGQLGDNASEVLQDVYGNAKSGPSVGQNGPGSAPASGAGMTDDQFQQLAMGIGLVALLAVGIGVAVAVSK
jgi:hypothetical protein